MKAIVHISGSVTSARVFHGELGEGVEFFNKADFSGKSLLAGLRRLRKAKVEDLYFFCESRDNQYNLFALKLIGFASRAGRIRFADADGCSEPLPPHSLFSRDVPVLCVGLLYALLVLCAVPAVFACLAALVVCAMPRKPRQNGRERLCYLRTDFWFGLRAGGSLTHTQGFINAGLDLGHEILVVSVDPLIHYGLRTRVNVVPPSRILRYLPIQIAQLEYNLRLLVGSWRHLREHPPTAFYQRMSSSNFAGPLLALVWRAPLILEFNSSSARHWQRGSLEALWEWLNLRGASRIAVVSSELQSSLARSGVPRTRIVVNPNGVDPTQFGQTDASTEEALFDAGDGEWIGYAGTFRQWQGVLTLARCVRHVVRRRPRARFLVIGDGSLKGEMLRILEADGMLDHVTFTGLVSHEEVPRYLGRCAVLASPHEHMADGSTFFGSPTKIFEYMAMAKGIVATGVGQLGEILENDRNALLVDPGDPEGLAEALVRLLEDDELRTRLGTAARSDVLESFTWQKNFERIVTSVASAPTGDGGGRRQGAPEAVGTCPDHDA